MAQRKRKILGDIETIQVRYASESSDLGIIDLVDTQMVRAYTDHVRLQQCPAQVENLDGTIDQLENEYADLTRQLNLAKAEGDSLNAQISGASTNVGPLQSQVAAAEAQAEEITRRYAAYEEMVSAQGVPVPESADEFWNLREDLSKQAAGLAVKLERGREASTDAEYAQKAARMTRDHAAKELKRVEHVGSALPEYGREPERVRVVRSALHLLHVSDLDQRARVEHVDALTGGESQPEIMRDQDHAHAALDL